jgi:hypothetical protein
VRPGDEDPETIRREIVAAREQFKQECLNRREPAPEPGGCTPRLKSSP